MKPSKFFGKWKFIFFITSFIFFFLPPFYFLNIKSIFFQTHTIAKYILLILFIYAINHWREKKIKAHSDPILFFFILLYFISQSVSVFTAYNIQAFLGIYQYIFFGLSAFFLSSYFFKTKKDISIFFRFIVSIVILHISYEFILYFFPQSFLFLKTILYEKYWEAIFIEISRGKFFLDMYDYALIPILLFIYIQSKRVYIKIGMIFLINTIIFFSFLSNFRIPFLLSLSSLGFSLVYFFKKIGKNMWIFIASALISCIFAYNIANVRVGYNVAQRFISSPEKAGFSSAEDTISRSYLWNRALEFGLSSPIIGIGLGNFYDYMPQSKNFGASLFDWRNNLIRSASQHPHNIFLQTFAESGFFGLISFTGLIILFIIRDFFILKKEPHISGALIISFWSLFIFGLFHNAFILQYLVLFWSLRGVLSNIDLY